MDVYLKAQQPMIVEFVDKDNVVNLSSSKAIDVVFAPKSVEVKMTNAAGPDISMFANMIRGASVIRITQAEFDTISPRKDVWYFVTNTSNTKILSIYAGAELFAKADQHGNIGFPYIFPLTF